MAANRFLNMDIMRYILSTAVIIAHFNILTNSGIPFPISSGSAVGIFFGISGFLVYGSFLKTQNLNKYIRSRAQRIIPPYLFIVLVCAFGLSLVSEYTLIEYFRDAKFWKYLISNIFFLNFLQPSLPGVFDNGGINAVNASLWTLKVEWALYLSIPVFFYGIRKYKWNIPLSIVIIFICSLLYTFIIKYLADHFGNPTLYKFSYQFVGQLGYFYTGVLIYHYKKIFSNRKWELMLLLAILMFAVIENNIFNLNFRYIEFISPVLLTFAALLFCLSKPISRYTSKLGNVSYEMYLFHFPIIQLSVYFNIGHYFSEIIYFFVVYTIIVLSSLAFQKTYMNISSFKKIK